MKRIHFRVEETEWHFYADGRRHVYDFTDPAIDEEAWNEGRVVAFLDAEGYFERHDQFEPLPARSWRTLPFQYFEMASDIPLGRFEIERLTVASGIPVKPTGKEVRPSVIRRIVDSLRRGWRPGKIHLHDVPYLRLLALTPFEHRPARGNDFLVAVYERGERLP